MGVTDQLFSGYIVREEANLPPPLTITFLPDIKELEATPINLPSMERIAHPETLSFMILKYVGIWDKYLDDGQLQYCKGLCG